MAGSKMKIKKIPKSLWLGVKKKRIQAGRRAFKFPIRFPNTLNTT
jgi:hypothetical protein